MCVGSVAMKPAVSVIVVLDGQYGFGIGRCEDVDGILGEAVDDGGFGLFDVRAVVGLAAHLGAWFCGIFGLAVRGSCILDPEFELG